MSGGHFDYENDHLASQIYDYLLTPTYGANGFGQSKLARQINPFEDIVISELIFDVFCLIHSYDWYKSGDTCEKTYRDDVLYFKNKWLRPLRESYIRSIIDDEIQRARDSLYTAFNIQGVSDENSR